MSPLSLQRVPMLVGAIGSVFGFGCATLPVPDAATVAAAAAAATAATTAASANAAPSAGAAPAPAPPSPESAGDRGGAPGRRRRGKPAKAICRRGEGCQGATGIFQPVHQ